MGKQSYQDLIVWQKAIAFVLDIYRISKRWPADEVYGLTNQVRRAAVSIPANVAEGNGRTGAKEFLHHLSIANGSLHEVETHLILGAASATSTNRCVIPFCTRRPKSAAYSTA
jgi:four helix bundle protein